MSYCVKADVLYRMSATDVTALVAPASEDDTVAAIIADSDAEIDLWPVTASWTAAQLKAASVALTTQSLWERRPDVDAPATVISKAARWRALFSVAPTDVVSDVIFNPMLDESSEEIAIVQDGP